MNFVVLTDSSGANRVYETDGQTFASWDGHDTLVDDEQNAWQVSEAELRGSDETTLARLPAHRAFWFGWFAAFPNTRLVK